MSNKIIALQPTPRVGRLDTQTRIRREAARLYADARAGRVTPSDASKLGTVLGLVARILENADLEARIAALEAGGKPALEP